MYIYVYIKIALPDFDRSNNFKAGISLFKLSAISCKIDLLPKILIIIILQNAMQNTMQNIILTHNIAFVSKY